MNQAVTEDGYAWLLRPASNKNSFTTETRKAWRRSPITKHLL